jgi:hypothetical protein
MALSNQTIQKLSDALAPEVIDYIFADERWIDFLHEIIPDAIEDKLGNVDENLKFDLGMCIMDKISFKIANS